MHEDHITSQPQFAVQTLGCKLNYAETSQLARQFVAHGFVQAPISANTRVFLLNTCSVTYNAERECRLAIRRVRKAAPDAFIAVTGCYAQLRPEQIASIEGVDLVLGAKEKFKLFELLGSFEKRSAPKVFVGEIADANEFEFSSSEPTNDRTRAFLKVQDGCDYTCSFCTIPKARGASRSTDIDRVVAEASRLSREGFREIVLTGVNVGDYGRKTGESLLELVQALDISAEIEARIRISSIEPNLLHDDLIDFISSSRKFCHHFHLPLQSGSNPVLRRMQRRYTSEIYRSRVERIKRLMPDASIGADVIVGFPAESEAEFQQTQEFITDLAISYLHVFTYSERPGTLATTNSSPVSPMIRNERNKVLRMLSEKKRHSFYETQIGRRAKVVLEHTSEGCSTGMNLIRSEGYTENYVRVQLESPVDEEIGLIEVELIEVVGEVMHGRTCAILGERLRGIRTGRELLPILQAA